MLTDVNIQPLVAACSAGDGRFPFTLTRPLQAFFDAAYLDSNDVHAKIATALAQVVREKPPQPLRRLAQLIAPESYVEPPPAATPPAATGEPPAAEE